MDADYGIPRELSDLQKLRSHYHPELPPCLQVQLFYFSTPFARSNLLDHTVFYRHTTIFFISHVFSHQSNSSLLLHHLFVQVTSNLIDYLGE